MVKVKVIANNKKHKHLEKKLEELIEEEYKKKQIMDKKQKDLFMHKIKYGGFKEDKDRYGIGVHNYIEKNRYGIGVHNYIEKNRNDYINFN